MQNIHVSEQTAVMFSVLMVVTCNRFWGNRKATICLEHFNKWCTAFFIIKKNQSQCKQNQFYIVFIDSSSKVNNHHTNCWHLKKLASQYNLKSGILDIVQCRAKIIITINTAGDNSSLIFCCKTPAKTVATMVIVQIEYLYFK